MAKFEMYQQFENRKSGRIAHVARIDEVCKTIILMYDEAREGDKENGVTLSYPSVSKNWKRLDTYAHPDLSSSEVKKADKTTEDKASDGTSYSEVMSEIIEDEKKAMKQVKSDKKKSKKVEDSKVKEKKAKTEKPDSEVIQSLLDYVYKCVADLGGDIGIPRDEAMKFRALRKNGKQFCKLMWSAKSIKLYTKHEIDNYTFRKVNYPSLPIMYEFNDNTSDTLNEIKTVLSESYKNFKNKKED